MNINGPSELYNFVKANNISNIAPEVSSMIFCLDSLSKMCACDPPEAKTGKYNQCKELYINFVSKSKNYSSILLSKCKDGRINFYINNQYITCITR